MMTRQCAAILALGLLVAPAIAEEPAVFRSEKDKVSYVIGLDMARNFRRQGVECDLDFVVKGLKDGFSDEKPLIPEGDFRQTLVEIQAGVRQKQALMRGKGPVEANKKRGEIFLAENKAKDGVVALPSGMQYRRPSRLGGSAAAHAGGLEVAALRAAAVRVRRAGRRPRCRAERDGHLRPGTAGHQVAGVFCSRPWRGFIPRVHPERRRGSMRFAPDGAGPPSGRLPGSPARHACPHRCAKRCRRAAPATTPPPRPSASSAIPSEFRKKRNRR